MQKPLVIVDTDRRHVDAQQPSGSLKRLDLSPKELDLLIVLAEANGKFLTREELLYRIWGYRKEDGRNLDTRTVDQHIARIRIKLGKASRNAVQTVTNYGYRCEGVDLIGEQRPVAEVKAVTAMFEKGKPWLLITHKVPHTEKAPKVGAKHRLVEVA